ncbi:MAG: DNA polymerase III subunit alpha [SAR202 cluster bacterium]|nr:DNA polymerase III subunit alpha [SAR202 cluster bacterium]
MVSVGACLELISALPGGPVSFTHLHVHTEYSLLDGLCFLDKLVDRAKQLGMNALGMTDHGGLYGAIDFYRIAKKAGVKPIIGCEMYVAPGSRHDRTSQEKPYHMTVLAHNNTGYANLVKLVTKSHLEGFYYKPRIDRELLEKHLEGLIILSGCPSGEVPRLITHGRMDEAKKVAAWYRDRFPAYHLELMEHTGVPELPEINKGLLEINKSVDIPLVATNDVHYINKEDARLQDILICIQTNTNVNDPKRMRMEDDSYYLKSPQEMSAMYPELPGAISNTMKIAEMCTMELDFTRLHLPQYKVPGGLTAQKYLEKICEEGLARRIPNASSEDLKRLEYELSVIKYTKYANYFLVVWDIAKFVRDRDIAFAVRGSAAASLVLYCLGVTDVNPMTYRLVFERFLNIERKEMPDIDMDFQDDRREEVLNYVVERYGREHVAQIITFGTLGPKAAIRDVGRALAMPYGDVDRIARLVPNKLKITLDDALATSTELKELYDADEGIKNLVDTARSLEGVTRNTSTHAAGVVISEDPLDDFVPLQRPAKAEEDSTVATTQYAMEPVAALGLLKMDFLGLINLSILAKTRKLIEKTRDIKIDLKDIPLDDRNTFDLLSRGDTVGVFQLEGSGMTRYIKELKPTSLGDVASMIALYRPGPMEHISTFIDAKHGRAPVTYVHPALKDILEETYGVIVFQDQVLLIVRTFAGYSLGEADIVRKAMGKKNPEIMAKEKDKFLKGAVKLGYTQELAEQIFTLIEPFAGYAFNKAHSYSYGFISYWTGYLKANYTPEYMVCLLNAYSDLSEKVAATIVECRRMGIPVHPPHIWKSQAQYAIETQEDGTVALRVGLSSIKNVGSAVIDSFIASRAKAEQKPSTIEDLCRSVDIGGMNRKTLESLIKAGAFDDYGDRGALLESIGRIQGLAQSESSLKSSNQTSMFGMFGDSTPAASAGLAKIDLPAIATPSAEKQAWEVELLGIPFSGADMLNLMAYYSGSEAIMSRSDITPEMDRNKVIVRGQVSGVEQRATRDGKQFLKVSLALLGGNLEVLVWENAVEQVRAVMQTGNLVTVNGTVRVRDTETSISCQSAQIYKLPVEEGSSQQSVVGSQLRAADPKMAAAEAKVAPHSEERPREKVVAPPPAAASPVNGANGFHKPNGNGNSAPKPYTNGGTNGARPAASQSPSPSPQPHSPRLLTVRIRESAQTDADQMLLDDIRRLLLEHQGQDPVNLEIATDGRIITMEWPVLRVNISETLERDLQNILGTAGRCLVRPLLM